MNKTLTLHAKTLTEVKDNLFKEIPPGFFLLSWQEIDPQKTSIEAIADTIDQAFDKARKKLPRMGTKISEKVISEQKNINKQVTAFSDEDAKNKVIGEYEKAVQILKVNLAKKGFRGFLGIGKKPNLYNIELFSRAKVSIEYQPHAQITARITDDINIADDSYLSHSEQGNYQLVEQLLQQGVNINATNSYGATALILSAFNGHTDICNLLINKGVDFNLKDKKGFNALMVGCESAKADIELIKKLIDSGIDINTSSTGGATALMAAAKIGHYDIVKLLVSNGAEINDRNTDHNITALIWAANEGHYSIAKYLLEKGADTKIVTKNNYTASSIAAENNHYDIVELINNR